MPKHRIADLAGAVERAADNWPSRRGITNKPLPFERYSGATDRLIADVVSSEPLKGYEMLPAPSQFGIRMMFRTCYIASTLARNEQMELAQLSEAMHDPRTFDVLETIQLTSPIVGERLEEHMGMIPSERGIADFRLQPWNFSNGALAYDGLDELVAVTKDRVLANRTDGECPLRKAKLNQRVFGAVVSICERDTNLFDRSLNEPDSAHAR